MISFYVNQGEKTNIEKLKAKEKGQASSNFKAIQIYRQEKQVDWYY